MHLFKLTVIFLIIWVLMVSIFGQDLGAALWFMLLASLAVPDLAKRYMEHKLSEDLMVELDEAFQDTMERVYG